MTAVEHDIVAQVYAAKEDSGAADQFIQQYLPFIRSETAKFVGTAPDHRYEDELSIAMLAFYEAILGYARTRGAFLPYAARAIKHRLIDYTRKEKRHQNVVSLHTPYGEEERTLEDTLPAQNGLMEEYDLRQASQQEIQEFGAQLAQFGLTFSQVADNSPKQARTLTACHRVLDYARQTPHLLDRFLETRRLPIKELSQGAGVDKKTIERHRAYLVAILLAFTNGYEIIRGHLCQMTAGKGGSA